MTRARTAVRWSLAAAIALAPSIGVDAASPDPDVYGGITIGPISRWARNTAGGWRAIP